MYHNTFQITLQQFSNTIFIEIAISLWKSKQLRSIEGFTNLKILFSPRYCIVHNCSTLVIYLTCVY